jgi:hypothetical protein
MIVGTIVVSVGAVALPVLGGILLAPRGGYLAAAHSERSRSRPENWTLPRRRPWRASWAWIARAGATAFPAQSEMH